MWLISTVVDAETMFSYEPSVLIGGRSGRSARMQMSKNYANKPT